MFSRYLHKTLVTLSLSAVSATAVADSEWQSAMTGADWDGSIGAGAFYAPDYLGSDDYETHALPNINLRYGERFYLNIRDGLGWNLLNQNDWQLSTFLGYVGGRDNEGDIEALDEVDSGAALGLRLRYQAGPFDHSASVRTPVTGDVDGYQIKLRSSWRTPVSDNLSLSVGPGLTYSSKQWTEDLFNISAVESARSGLPRFSADSGYLRARLGGALTYRMTPSWSLTGLAGVAYLTGEAEDSPIVDDVGNATQAFGGALINYRF
ncbi:outer membrane protein [Marinobacter segnicrescens]|uniref:Outer membrane protein n=1 Tax=Marinobacter segnicrescens TaxID=430453 RepID=A0A1I0I6D2_9GAMM|nr:MULTISPECIES: MipA/OmpV family protein [Marinobacter]SET92078.1 outer membrane protein [Marinobacter segnicrescens]